MNKGQADGVHVLLVLFVILLVIALGFTCYMLYKGKQTTNQTFDPESKPRITDFTPHCGFLSCCNNKVEELREGNKDGLPSH